MPKIDIFKCAQDLEEGVYEFDDTQISRQQTKIEQQRKYSRKFNKETPAEIKKHVKKVNFTKQLCKAKRSAKRYAKENLESYIKTTEELTQKEANKRFVSEPVREKSKKEQLVKILNVRNGMEKV